ncbi:MAG TPA: preprotein translocase subunit SecY [Candidatus Paceibacterota bacterium]
MKAFLEKLRLLFTDRSLRKRILFVFGALVVFRLLAAIPIPGVSSASLAELLRQNQFLGLLNIFSGGGLANFSIVMLGVSPYITATIIMQLLTMVFPRLKEIYHEEGEAGRKKFSQYSRLLSVPLGMLQGIGLLALIASQGVFLTPLVGFEKLLAIIVITAGSILLMWIGELINEFGIGNGTSIIIFSGIVAGLPASIYKTLFSNDFLPNLPLYVLFLVVAVVIVAGVVLVTEAERPIPVTYAKRVRGTKMYGGMSTYLPLRLNQAGVIPIIFALSILLFPQMITNLLANSSNSIIQSITSFANMILQNQWIYGILYFSLVFVFTYFYTAITFDPAATAENLQKSGAFIPGTRPGASTTEHLSQIVTRLTTFGALFLGVIAVLPIIMQGATGISTLAIGGTGLLIVVSVVIDLMKQLNAQLSIREY